MWGELAVLAVISLILFNFIVPRNLTRALLIFALWVVFFEVLEIIFALIIVNKAQLSKPDESAGDDDF